MSEIPDKWREKNPLITEAGYKTLQSIRQHSAAPKWQFEIGDRVGPDDLAAATAFKERLFREKSATGGALPSWLPSWIESMRGRSYLFEERLPAELSLPDDWATIPTTTREDLATRLVDIVPVDADLDGIIAYDTSGTTGHAVDVPTHPRVLACAHAFAEYALSLYGIDPEFGPGQTACINVCAQQSTYVFATVFSVWNQAGFAKVNLREQEWAGGKEGARRFFSDLDPVFITADPVAISEMLAWDLPIKPQAIFSTAVALGPGLQKRAADHFGCPVIDWYSTTETGPIACSAPDGRGLVTMAPDLYVEVVDGDGRPVAPGEWGEIAVTGGRNPYLPLLRYRTGDRGRLEGDRIVEMEGRDAVAFYAADGSVVNSVNIARILRLHSSFVQHQFVQYEDRSCEMIIRPTPGVPVDKSLMIRLLEGVFGEAASIEVRVDERLGDEEKVVPYIQEAKS